MLLNQLSTTFLASEGDKMFVGNFFCNFDFTKNFDKVDSGKWIFAKALPEKCSQ